MAGLSYRALNNLNTGFGGSSSSSIYQAGVNESEYNKKKLAEQYQLIRDQLALDLISQGYGTESQQAEVISNTTGYDLDTPETVSKYDAWKAKNSGGEMINYGGLIGYRRKQTPTGQVMAGNVTLAGPTANWTSYDRIAAQQKKIRDTAQMARELL
jgi:hypothetical protein